MFELTVTACGLWCCPSCASEFHLSIGDISMLPSGTQSFEVTRKVGLFTLKVLCVNGLPSTLQYVFPPFFRRDTMPHCFIQATVLLSSVFAFLCHELRSHLPSRASVSFLAVTGIDNATRIATLLSVVMTLGSIMIGIYALWRHQGGVEYNVSRSSHFLNK
jgi:hypothetical protein